MPDLNKPIFHSYFLNRQQSNFNVNLISKEFQLIVEQKISTKFISQFCFNLNKKTYEIIVDYLKQHKEQKGQKQISYDNLWPMTIDEPQVRIEIENLPTEIMRLFNKDLSEAYNLMMESLTDPTLKKLIKYDRIRDLYQLVTEIILNKKSKPRKEKKEKKDLSKDATHKKTAKTVKVIEKNKDKTIVSPNEWNLIEERYLCALYLQRPLLKCCEKMKDKFGESQKWSTTNKIFKKAEQIFEKSLKKIFRSNQLNSLKEVMEELQTNKQNLIYQVIKKKSNLIQKYVLKYHRSNDLEKKNKSIQEINGEMLVILERPELLKKISQMAVSVSKEEQKVKKEENGTKITDIQGPHQDKQIFQTGQLQVSDEVKLEIMEENKIVLEEKKVE